MENRRESRLREDSALTDSNAHIHHFPPHLFYFMLLFKKLLIFLIVSLFDFLEWNNVTITNTNTIR